MSDPIVSTTPKGSVLPAGWQDIDIRSWCGDHGPEAQSKEAHIVQAEGKSEKDCGGDCDCDCPPSTC